MSALSDALNEANVDQLSVREIARRGGDRVHHSALGKYFKPNHGRPGEDVLQVFSDVFHIPITKLRRLAELPVGDDEPYEPPAEANRLDRRQRRVIDELIRMLAETKAGDGDDRDAAPIGAIRGPMADVVITRPDGVQMIVEVKGTTWHTTGSGKAASLLAVIEQRLPSGYQIEPARDDVEPTSTMTVDELIDSIRADAGLVEDIAARPTTE